MRFALALCFIVSFLLMGAQDSRAQAEVSAYLTEIHELAEKVLAVSEEAAGAADVAGVKSNANSVFEMVWGSGSGLGEEDDKGAVHVHGWKTRWQVDNGFFDEAFAERYGVVPPEVTDIKTLGMMGRGRAARKMMQEILDGDSASMMQKKHAEAAIASLNNVIGWMKMDNGVTKGELQPRVDLTREWDSPSEFWLSTSDTGWLLEVYSQAINIMKVDYAGDVDEARKHARGMADLAKRVLEGLDANKDGVVKAEKMEGGLNAALEQAQAGGFVGT
ncbi:MAG: hypothetical protein AB8G77_14305 [Rhodothermales bacterium]